jgi:hypothetical protein
VSRLDSFIRRVAAQRDCLNAMPALIRDVPGPVLELGLGNGRTYDHLREILPDREIFVFDRRVAAHPDCIPDDAHMILGDITVTLPAAMERICEPAALAHCDIGTGVAADNRRLIAAVAPALDRLMRRGGIVVSDQRYDMPNWTPLLLPDGVAPGRYYVNRVG